MMTSKAQKPEDNGSDEPVDLLAEETKFWEDIVRIKDMVITECSRVIAMRDAQIHELRVLLGFKD